MDVVVDLEVCARVRVCGDVYVWLHGCTVTRRVIRQDLDNRRSCHSLCRTFVVRGTTCVTLAVQTGREAQARARTIHRVRWSQCTAC